MEKLAERSSSTLLECVGRFQLSLRSCTLRTLYELTIKWEETARGVGGPPPANGAEAAMSSLLHNNVRMTLSSPPVHVETKSRSSGNSSETKKSNSSNLQVSPSTHTPNQGAKNLVLDGWSCSPVCLEGIEKVAKISCVQEV